MANVIRDDVVQLSFEVEGLKEIKKMQDDINELKKKLSGMDDSAFDDIKAGAEECTKPVKKVKERVEELKNKLNDVGKKAATTAFNGLKKLAGISFKALSVGIGAAAAAIGKIGYEAVQAFADFEQLKGGVETLFGAGGARTVEEYAKTVGKTVSEVKGEYEALKSAENKVFKNANNAYKTAGLSANDYMETVTSFSASLIQSLGGDTKKAADYAHRAIVDMSDNANKMGTDMSSIQYAYQGFAKQNYTMLDNLKLGYGGTKEEMQRLIKDAAKMTDVQKKLGISVDSTDMSFGNIVNAISVVQESMGVAGTTSKEAAGTITGSLNAMKSAWGNLLTAMGSGEGLDQCIDNMIESVETFGRNVMPVATRALSGIGNVIERLTPIIAEKLPELAKELIPPLIKSAVSLTKGLIQALPDIIKSVFDTIVDICGDQFPVLRKIGEVFSKNAKSIAKYIPALLGLVGAFMAFSKIKSVASVFSGLFGKSSGGKSGGIFGGIANLAKIKPTVVLKGMANLSIMLGGFVILGAAFAAAAPYIAKLSDFKSILELAGIMAILGVLGLALAKLGSIAGAIPVSTVAKGLANMAIMIGGIGVLSAAFALAAPYIAKLSDTKSMLKLATTMGVLGVLGLALTAFAAVAGLIPIPIVLTGLANMAIILAGFGVLAAAFALAAPHIAALSDMKSILKMAAIMGILGVLGTALTVFAAIAGIIPIPVVLAGLANMALVLGGVTALIVAFGALSKVDGFNEFIKSGGETLANIFGIIGKIGGSLIGGLGEGISDALPAIGKNLGKFGENIKPLFSSMKGIDMSGVAAFFLSLVGLLGIATGNEIVEGIKSFFGGGESTLSKLGTQLADFATKSQGFFKVVSGMPENGFTNATKLFNCLAGVKSLPKEGGVVGWFTGNISYDSLASGLAKLASGSVVSFFNTVAGFKQAGFDNAKKLFDCLAGLKSLPKDGGVVGWFGGSVKYDKIATGLGQLSGDKVKKFFTMVGGLNSKAFDNVKLFFSSLASISELPKEGGWWDKLTGTETTTIGNIAKELGTFGEKTSSFFSQVNKLNLSNLNGLWNSLKNAGKLTTKNLSGVVGDSISDIVDKISELPKKMGDALKNNSKDLSNGFVDMWKDAVKASVAPVNKLLDGANHILKEFGSKKKVISWTPYARGTNGHRGGNALVNDGNGAELVQMPNGNSFVPSGRNVFIPNAPKGMKVLPAEQTARLMGKKSPTFRYAGGIGDIDVWDYYDNSKGLIGKITDGISYKGMSGLALSMGESMVSTFSGEMPSWIDKLFEENGQSLASYVASKGVMQWLPTVSRALKMEGQYSAANVARTLFQMKTESGGNPKAINLWDSNAKKGIPSKGLMQVIDPTFDAYARKGFDKNIYDPLSNVLASIRYAVSRYGSLAKAYRGVGYANGGIATRPSIFGEDGAEMAIPLSNSKRDRGISLWAKTGEMLGLSSYTPEGDSGVHTSNHVENNTYAPQFTLTINGTNDDRTMARKVKNWVSEAMNETFSSMERKTPRLQEV